MNELESKELLNTKKVILELKKHTEEYIHFFEDKTNVFINEIEAKKYKKDYTVFLSKISFYFSEAEKYASYISKEICIDNENNSPDKILFFSKKLDEYIEFEKGLMNFITLSEKYFGTNILEFRKQLQIENTKTFLAAIDLFISTFE